MSEPVYKNIYGVSDEKFAQVVDQTEETERIVKAQETFLDRINRWRKGLPGRYLIDRDSVRGYSLGLKFEPPDKFELWIYGMGFETLVVGLTARLAFTATFSEAKAKYKTFLKAVKNGKSFEEIRGKEKWF